MRLGSTPLITAFHDAVGVKQVRNVSTHTIFVLQKNTLFLLLGVLNPNAILYKITGWSSMRMCINIVDSHSSEECKQS